MKELRRTFVAMDTDGSGTISKTEFRAVMSRYPDMARVDVGELFDAIDVGGRGQLEWRWFLASTLRAAPGRSSRGAAASALSSGHPAVTDTFLMLDRDADGVVTVEDLQAMLAGSADPAARGLGAQQIARMLQVATGAAEPVQRLSLEEFKSAVLSSTPLSEHLNRTRRSGAAGRWRKARMSVAATRALSALVGALSVEGNG